MYYQEFYDSSFPIIQNAENNWIFQMTLKIFSHADSNSPRNDYQMWNVGSCLKLWNSLSLPPLTSKYAMFFLTHCTSPIYQVQICSVYMSCHSLFSKICYCGIDLTPKSRVYLASSLPQSFALNSKSHSFFCHFIFLLTLPLSLVLSIDIDR